MHGFTIDENRCKVLYKDNEIELTVIESHLFKVLLSDLGRIFSRLQLMEIIYKDRRVVSDRVIDGHIKKLRKKILAIVPNKEVIHSVYSVGYRYEVKE